MKSAKRMMDLAHCGPMAAVAVYILFDMIENKGLHLSIASLVHVVVVV